MCEAASLHSTFAVCSTWDGVFGAVWMPAELPLETLNQVAVCRRLDCSLMACQLSGCPMLATSVRLSAVLHAGGYLLCTACAGCVSSRVLCFIR
jgi:hypothetical protein